MRPLRRLFPALILLFTVHASLAAQPVGSWTAYPSLSSVRELAETGDGAVWIATAGGVFRFDGTRSGTILTPMNGLYQASPTAMRWISARGELWMGFADGMLQVYRPADGSFSRMTDLSRAQQFTRRDVTGFLMKGDTLLVSTGFGIAAINPARMVVMESYTRFASLDAGQAVLAMWREGAVLAAATARGVVRSATPATWFVPSSWELLPVTGTPSGSAFTAVLQQGGVLHATAGGATFRFTGTGWTPATLFGGRTVLRFRPWAGGAMAVTINALVHLPDGGSPVIFPVPGDRVTAAAPSADRILIGTGESGTVRWNSTVTQPVDTLLPNGPALNLFSSLAYRNGRLLSASSTIPGTGGDFSNTGYYFFENGRWTSRSIRSDTALSRFGYNAVHLAHLTPTHAVLGSFGQGLATQRLSDGRISVYNRSNSPLFGLASSPAFVVITGLSSDRDGRIWSTMLSPSTPLAALTPETGVWKTFAYPPILSSSNEYSGVLADSYGQVWVALGTPGGGGNGLLVLKPGSLTDDSDNRQVHLTESSANLPGPRVNALIQDKRGEIWIGTSRGVARFLFPELVVEGGAAERQAQWLIAEENGERFYFLRDLSVTSMAVNAANQKWIGSSDNGLWLVDESGSAALHHFTRENSPLISNFVRSLAVDESTGTVFIATDLGLISYVETAREARGKPSGLFVYPNPYSYAKNGGDIIIDRLTGTTTVSVMSADGALVRRLEGASGRISWDARDGGGRRLPPGVYLIVAHDRNGAGRAAGKVIITP